MVTVQTILYSWENSFKLVWSRKVSLFRHEKVLLGNLVPGVPSFYIPTKSGLKNRVTAVHLLQCKTNFFIRLCFQGTNVNKLKNIHLGKPPLISKNFFDSFTLVYIRLDPSTIV